MPLLPNREAQSFGAALHQDLLGINPEGPIGVQGTGSPGVGEPYWTPGGEEVLRPKDLRPFLLTTHNSSFLFSESYQMLDSR